MPDNSNTGNVSRLPGARLHIRRVVDQFARQPVYIFLFLFTCFCIVSCSGNNHPPSEERYRINNTDKLEMFFKYNGSVLHHIDSSKKAVDLFKKVLDGKIENKKCAVSGEIRFISGDSVLLYAGFSLDGGKEPCQYVMRGEKAWRLTYNAAVYLSETLTELSRNK